MVIQMEWRVAGGYGGHDKNESKPHSEAGDLSPSYSMAQAHGDRSDVSTPATRTQSRAASVRVSRSPAFRSQAQLTIDTNVVDSVFSPKNPLETHAVGEIAGDRQIGASPFLEYGMIVSLVCDERGGIICAEGYASRDVRLEKLHLASDSLAREGDGATPARGNEGLKLGLGRRTECAGRLLSSPFHDCLFEIVPKMSYEATLTLQDLSHADTRETNHGARQSDSGDVSGKRGLQPRGDLQFKSEAETRLNATTYRKLMGSRVLYGHSVQFRHSKTGEFLSLATTTSSLRGADHTDINLEKGSSRAHFTILPRFKLRARGAPIQVTDQLLLVSGTGSEEQPFSLQASSRRTADNSSVAVVGSRAQSTAWRAILFDRAVDTYQSKRQAESGIRAGDCVRLLHLESACMLQYSSRRPRQQPSVSLQFRDDDRRFTSNEDTTCGSSESIWMVEKSVICEGGELAWRDSVFLRHVATGRYLSVETVAHSHVVESRPPIARQAIACRVHTDDVPHAFSFVSTAVMESEHQMLNSSVALIQHMTTKAFVHSPETHASTVTDIRISSMALGNGDTGTSVFSVGALAGARDEDAFKIIKVTRREVDDTLLLLSYKKVMGLFVSKFAFQNRQAHDCAQSAAVEMFDREDVLALMIEVENAVSNLIAFCSEGIRQSRQLHQLRQSMFRAHDFIDLLVEMIKAPFDRFGGPFTIDFVSSFNSTFQQQSRNAGDPDMDLIDHDVADIPKSSSGKPPAQKAHLSSAPVLRNASRKEKWVPVQSADSSAKAAPHVQVMQTLTRIIPLVNSLLVQIFSGHRANEIYVAQNAMPILIELLGNGFHTSFPLSHLLRESRNLVESMTAYNSIIRNFFELIKTRGRSIRYMQFLVATCVSRGRGVPKTQEAISDLLFNPSNGFRDFVMVPIRANAEGLEVFAGSRKELHVRNQVDIPDGRWIGLGMLYQDYYIHGKHRALGQYCYGLLQLYVALCLDRNYVSIDYIQTSFPRNSLLQAVHDTTLPRSIRAVLLDLLRVSYVDCEPQRVMTCPNYTRTWTEVPKRRQDIELPSFSVGGYSSEDLAFFKQLKSLCSSYFTHLRGKIVVDVAPESQVTLAVVKVCKKMVEFGMYSTEVDLSGLVQGLVDLLDNRLDVNADSQPQYNAQNRRHEAMSLEQKAGSVRAREASATENLHDLFNTVVGSDPARRDTDGHAALSGDTKRHSDDAPLISRLRNSALLDGASTPGDRDRTIARQYGTGSLIWKQHCGATSGADQSSGSSLPSTSRSGHGADVVHRHLLPLNTVIRNQRTSEAYRSASTLTPVQLNKSASPYEIDILGCDQAVLEIKDECCAVLKLVDSIRLDYQLSSFLVAFRSQHGHAEVIDWPPGEDHAESRLLGQANDRGSSAGTASQERKTGAGLGEKSSPVTQLLFNNRSMECQFSLSQLGKRNVNTVLMQMLMYEYPPLVSKALELLLQQFNQHDQLLSSLQNLQLLVNEDTIAIYNRLKDDVNELRRLSETTEMWMDLTSKFDFENAEWVCSLLHSIRLVITKQTSVADQGENKPSRSTASSSILRSGIAIHTPQRRVSAACIGAVEVNGLSPSEVDNSYLFVGRAPPNRKTRLQSDRYNLNCDLGKVSLGSGCHELLPMARFLTAELQPLRTVRSHSTVLSSTSEARRLLRNLKAAQYVISMMEDGAHFYEAHRREKKTAQHCTPTEGESSNALPHRQRNQIRDVFEEALQFLCAFCEGDPENQVLVAPHATTIAQYACDLEIAQQVLVSIYASNMSLCKSVPTEVVNAFVHKLVQEPITPRYLYFLETIVLCDENPMHENQLLVLFQLNNSFESETILQFFDEPARSIELFSDLFDRYQGEAVGDHEARKLTAAVESSSEGRHDSPDSHAEPGTHEEDANPTAQDSKLLEYHVRLLHLFAACASGKNVRCQEICQQTVPLPVVLDLLMLRNCTEGIQFALLRFLQHVFLTDDDVDFSHEELHDIFAHITRLVERVAIQYVKELHDEDTKRHAAAALQKSKRVKEAVLTASAKARDPTESKALYLIIVGAVPTLLGFMQQYPHFVDSSCDFDADEFFSLLSHSLAAMLAVSSVGERCLHDTTIAALDELCHLLDRSLPIDRPSARHPLSLSVLWREAQSRTDRLDLSQLVEIDNIGNTADAILDARDAELRQSSLHGSVMNSPPGSSLAPIRTTLYDRHKVGSSVVSEVENLHTTPAVRRRSGQALHQLKLNTQRVLHPVESTPKGSGSKSVTAGADEGRATGWWRQVRGISQPTQRNSPPNSRLKAATLHRRFGVNFVDSKKQRSLYSRHSSLSIQGSPTAKISSSLFSSHEQAHARHQRFEAFDQFLARLYSDPRVEIAMRDELNLMVDSILSVEASLHDEYDAKLHASNVCLTFDQIVVKLVAHVLAFQDSTFAKTNVILLDVFCRMIYSSDGNWERRHEMQIALNRLQVTKLVVQLISTRDDDAIFERSVELGVALLDGMNAEVQESFHKCWLELGDGHSFVNKIQQRVEKASQVIHNGIGDHLNLSGLEASKALGSKRALHEHGQKKGGGPDHHVAQLVKRRSVMIMHQSEATDIPQTSTPNRDERFSSPQLIGGPMTLTFRFLQLLCEGHYLKAKRFLIFQPNAKDPVNLVESTTTFLLDTYLALTDLDVGLIIQLFETITEFCQGPCVEAQDTVANFKFFSTVNALLVHQFLEQDNPMEMVLVRRLRASVVITLLSLLEGRSDRTMLTQLVKELNFDALQTNLIDVHRYFLAEYGGVYAGNVQCSDDFYLETGFNIYILLQKLADSFPTSASAWIPRAPGASVLPWTEKPMSSPPDPYYEAFAFFHSNCARVEIVWNNRRQETSHPSQESHSREKDVGGRGLHGENEGSLIAYYFPLHPICYCLTDQSKKKLVWRVSRGVNKLHDFYARSDKLVDEMAHQSRLLRNPILAIFARSADLLKRASFLLALTINFLVLIYYQADGIDSSPYAASRITFLAPLDDIVSDPASAAKIGLSIGGSIQLILCILILICYLVNSAPLLIKKGWKRRIRAQQDKLSKENASIHRTLTDLEDKETFQDTEQLLRSLRDREEEYDYLFLPRHHHKRSHVNATDASASRKSNKTTHSLARRRSFAAQDRLPSTCERLWRFLFGPASVMFRNETRAAAIGSIGGRASGAVSTVQYCQTVAISLIFLIRSPRVLYYFWQISIAILGAYINSLFFAFHLLDVVNRSQQLSNVLRSIVKPARMLGVTLVLYLVVVYVFSVVGFYFLREDYNPSAPLTAAQRSGKEPYQCQRLFQCFLISLDQGFKSDGGLGGYLKLRVMGESVRSYSRVVFDLLYNTILTVMLLNIVFGVIIDTFASLREADHEKLTDMQNRCFICSHDAYTFDRATKRGFHEHIYTEHNMWHYLYLFVHIRKKPITEYNGLELYLAMRMAKRDVSFFPNRRALCLEKSNQDSGDTVINSAELFGASESDRRSFGQPHDMFTEDFRASSSLSREAHAMVYRPDHHGQNSSMRSPRRGGSALQPHSPGGASKPRSAAAKLDKLEATIQLLLVSQNELREQHKRSVARQNELLEQLKPTKDPPSGSAVVGSGEVSSTHDPNVPAPSIARRAGSAMGERGAVGSASLTPSAMSSQADRRRQMRTPRVFNFDSIGEDSSTWK